LPFFVTNVLDRLMMETFAVVAKYMDSVVRYAMLPLEEILTSAYFAVMEVIHNIWQPGLVKNLFVQRDVVVIVWIKQLNELQCNVTINGEIILESQSPSFVEQPKRIANLRV